jgi:hypothetical protein
MEDWTKLTDEEVFSKVGEQNDSQTAYWRDIEIKRRVYLLQKGFAQSSDRCCGDTKGRDNWGRETIDLYALFDDRLFFDCADGARHGVFHK